MKSRTFLLFVAIGLLFLMASPIHAQNRFVSAFSPAGCQGCVRGPIFEEVREKIPTTEIKAPDYSQGTSLSGQILTTTELYYRDQPASMQTYTTQPGFPSEIVYMYKQFRPSNRDAWIRVDFGALVSIVPPSGAPAGLAYTLYVKEDGGDGVIANSGISTCGGDDTCGWLQQTYNAPWLLNCDAQRVWASVNTSNYFQVSGTPLLEIQVHIYPMHEGSTAGTVYVNNGFMAISSGKP